METGVEVEDASPPTQLLEPEKDFIITFETLPVLWDKTNKHYVNKYRRNEALEKLLIIYKKTKPRATLDDVKKKINTLRSNYRRELKKIESSRRSGAGADDIYIPKSWTFEYLRFLDKFEKPQSLDTNEHESTNTSDGPTSDILQSQGQEERESQESVSYGSISSANEVMPPPRPATKKMKSVVSKQNELLERACAYLSEPKSCNNSIAFEWAETLNRLDPTQRLYAKKAINDILFEAELGNLNRYSVQIHTAPPASSTAYHSPSPHPSQPSPNYVLTPLSSPSIPVEYNTHHDSTYSTAGSLFATFPVNE